MHRYAIYCSIDILFHLGALQVTRIVGLSRAMKGK
jgi:hypothetical protein